MLLVIIDIPFSESHGVKLTYSRDLAVLNVRQNQTLVFVTSGKLTLAKSSFWWLDDMTVGRSQLAKTCMTPPLRNGVSSMGCKPSVTFFAPESDPVK